MNTDITVLKSLTAVRLEVNIWSARKKLTPADFGHQDLPPEKLASLGSKKVCNPEDLRVFATLKARASALLDRHGVRFLGGWAIPESCVQTIIPALNAIAQDFATAKEEFLARYDHSIRQWLVDIDPLYAGLSASDAKKVLGEALPKAPPVRREGRLIPAIEAFLQDFVSTRGAMEVTSSEVMNPFAGGGSNNLYRCFIDLSFRLIAPQGYAALIHQDGHLGDPKSGAFRRHWYSRIVKHFGYINTIKSKNFADAAHYMRFSQNIYRGFDAVPAFEQFTTAFLAQQVEESFAHDGAGDVPDIKGADGKWDTRGHRDRVISIDQAALSVIHALSEEETVPVEEARFIQPYSARTLEVFRQMARFPKLDAAIPKIERTVSTAAGERTVEVSLWQMNRLWDEAYAQKDGTIRRETAFRYRGSVRSPSRR